MTELIELDLYNSVFFDLETQKSADEVGGWGNSKDMLISVAVTFNIREGYLSWYEDSVSGLPKYLNGFKHIVTFNGEKFDFKVLSHYAGTDMLYEKSFDLMLWIQKKLGKRASLEKVSQETLHVPEPKHGSGLQVIEWFKEGKIKDCQEHCFEDVRMMHDVVAYAKLYGFIKTYGKVLNIGYQNLPI